MAGTWGFKNTARIQLEKNMGEKPSIKELTVLINEYLSDVGAKKRFTEMGVWFALLNWDAWAKEENAKANDLFCERMYLHFVEYICPEQALQCCYEKLKAYFSNRYKDWEKEAIRYMDYEQHGNMFFTTQDFAFIPLPNRHVLLEFRDKL